MEVPPREACRQNLTAKTKNMPTLHRESDPGPFNLAHCRARHEMTQTTHARWLRPEITEASLVS